MLFESAPLTAYCVFVACVSGLCMGSFLNCMAWRMTHGESVLHGRSHCTSCGHMLAARDLVPLFSWLATRGTCRYCGAHVSARYPVTEALCAVVYVSIFLHYGLTLEMLEFVAFASVLLVLSLTDLDDYIIPNSTIVVSLVVRVAYIFVGGMLGIHDSVSMLLESLVGGFVVAVPVLLLALVMDHVLGKESLGGGDVKLLFVAGMYFGWQQCLLLLVIACVLGIVFGMVGMRANKADEKSDPALIPFGPSIALACWITMLVGTYVLNWYLSLFIG